MDSHNLQAPLLGKTQPVYPHLTQILRITSSSVTGPTFGSSSFLFATGSSSTLVGQTMYLSYVEQVDPSLLLPRDREPCLALDLNNIGLQPGYYTARLVSSYGGLPVYAPTSPLVQTTFIGQTFNYTDNDFTYNYGNTFNFLNTTVFNISNTYNVSVNGPGYWYFGSPLVVCGWLFWCFIDYIVGTSTLTNWELPSTRIDGEAVVFKMFSRVGDFAIAGIKPIPSLDSSAENGPRLADGGLPADGLVWANSLNVFFNDAKYATVTIPKSGHSAFLSANTYGFGVPIHARITGFTVIIRRGKTGAGKINSTLVNLHGNLGAPSRNKTDTSDWPVDDADLVLGGQFDNWGDIWSGQDVNGAGFGVSIKATENGTGAVDLRVDSILIIVWYTLDDAGQVIALVNANATETMTLLHESTIDPVEQNRLILEDSEDKDIGPRGMTILWRDPEVARWRSIRQPGNESPTLTFSGARLYRDSNQVIPNSAYTSITFNNSHFDNGGYANLVGPTPTRLTVPDDGYYAFGACIRFDSGASAGKLSLRLRLNGSTVIGEHSAPQPQSGGLMPDTTELTVGSMPYRCTAGDYVECQVYQNSGGNLDVVYSPSSSPEFWVELRGT